MKSRIPIECVVAVLAAISCLISWPGIGLPVWALFIGWAWYFALGATPKVLKSIYISTIPGAILAFLCIWLINILTNYTGLMLAMMISVLITVFLLMLVLKMPGTNSLPAFNAYSTIFAVFYGGFFPKVGVFSSDLIKALLWGIIGNFLGPVFGYLSIYFTFPVDIKKDNKANS
jgi:hypothetical protein